MSRVRAVISELRLIMDRENVVLQHTIPTVHTEIHALTFYWFSITPELICQLRLFCSIKRINHCSPCWLLIPSTSSLKEAFHYYLQTILIRAMLTLESIEINSINQGQLLKGPDKLFSQCPPPFHSFHN